VKASIQKACLTCLFSVVLLPRALAEADTTRAVRSRVQELFHDGGQITYQTNQRSGTISCIISCKDTNELNAVWEVMRSIPDKVRISQGPESVTVVVHLPQETVTAVDDQPAPPPRQEDNSPKYSVEVETSALSGIQLCDLVFKKEPLPPAEAVDKILRNALESLVSKGPSRNTLAMAFLNDDALVDETQYSGPLHYVAASKRILTDEEYSVEFNGTKIERQDKGAYYLESKEESNGKWKWLTINVVFAKPLPAREAYDFVEAEAERASRRGMDVDAYAKVGDRTIRTSWSAISDPGGGTVSMHYDSKTKKLQKWKDFIKQH